MKKTMLFVAVLAMLALADPPSIDKMTLKQLRTLAKEQGERITQLERENAQLQLALNRIHPPATQPADTRLTARWMSEADGLIINGSRYALHVKVKNEGTHVVNATFIIMMTDRDGDEINLPYPSGQTRFGAEVDHLLPGESKVFQYTVLKTGYDVIGGCKLVDIRPNP